MNKPSLEIYKISFECSLASAPRNIELLAERFHTAIEQAVKAVAAGTFVAVDDFSSSISTLGEKK